MTVAGMAPERVSAAVRALRAARKPRPREVVRAKLRRRRLVESSAVVGRRTLCRFGLCAEFAEVGGLCNSHDRAARRRLAAAVLELGASRGGR